MPQTLKIVIPMAGLGTRMRPHTWSRPKPLISVAGKPSLDHLLNMFQSVPPGYLVEYVFIIGHLGEPIREYMQFAYSDLRVHYVVQPEMKGQSHALWLAREHLTGPMLMVFSDTLIETDFSFLSREPLDGVAWVKPVPDPRRFGVAEVNAEGRVTRLIEKPQTLDNNLVVVGCYYFRSGETLLSAIEEQMRRGVALKGEFFLTDAINIMIERGAQMRREQSGVWLDTGTVEATLETNAYLLAHGHGNVEPLKRSNVTIVPPVFVHPTAQIEISIIGPNASIGPDCVIRNAVIRDSILEEGAQVTDAVLDHSFIGRQAKVEGRGADGQVLSLNIGDNSRVCFCESPNNHD